MDGGAIGDRQEGSDREVCDPAAQATAGSACRDEVDWGGFAGCEAVRQESHYCLGIGHRRLRLVGLDSHTTCAGPSYELESSGCQGCRSGANKASASNA